MTKKNLLILLMSSAIWISCSQETDVPASVISTFNNQYPDATEVEWEQDNDGFEVEFEVNEIEREITYDRMGNIVESSIEVSENELPANTIAYLNQNYPGYRVDDADEETNGDGIAVFEVEIEHENKEIELLFDIEGNFIEIPKEE